MVQVRFMVRVSRWVLWVQLAADKVDRLFSNTCSIWVIKRVLGVRDRINVGVSWCHWLQPMNYL